jgi:hypothetical protein
MITIRRALILILAITALLVAPAAVAAASPTKIVVSLEFPAFHGKLTSPRHGCLGSRTVKMYRRRSGKTTQLGSDKSEDNGKWAIPVGKHLTSGEYFATVAKRGACQAARSKVLTVD